MTSSRRGPCPSYVRSSSGSRATIPSKLASPLLSLSAKAAESLPEVSDDGLTYTIRIKRGVHFQDDACFTEAGGKGREVTAGDFVYSIKRLADVANKPRGWWLLQGKVVGLDEFHQESVERAAAGEDVDYERPVEGLKAIDRYTLQIRLKERHPQLKYALEMSYTAAVPREAVECCHRPGFATFYFSGC